MQYDNNSPKRIMKGLVMLVCALLVILISGGCGSKSDVYRVGVVYSLKVMAGIVDGFQVGMAEIGYKEGENIIYDVQETDTDNEYDEGVKIFLQKFVADKVDLIVTLTTGPALTAKAATEGTGVPVVFAMASLEGNDLVESVRQPGGNITGIRFPDPDKAAKSLEILHELTPQAKRIWVAYSENHPNIPPSLETLRKAASYLGIRLVEVPAGDISDIQADLEKRDKSGDIGMDAILLMAEPLATTCAAIGDFAAKHKLPLGGVKPRWGSSHSVFTYDPDFSDIGGLIAFLADKVLRGAPAGTIPVISPDSSLILNYKRAKELGLTVSEGLLGKASEIIR